MLSSYICLVDTVSQNETHIWKPMELQVLRKCTHHLSMLQRVGELMLKSSLLHLCACIVFAFGG